MNTRPSQFDARENTASSRQRATRLVVDTGWSAICPDGGNTQLPINDPLLKALHEALYAAQIAATGEGGDVNDAARPAYLFCEHQASESGSSEMRRYIRFE
jgi:hypothetical protein